MAYSFCLSVCLRDRARRGRKDGRGGLMNLLVSEMFMASFLLDAEDVAGPLLLL